MGHGGLSKPLPFTARDRTVKFDGFAYRVDVNITLTGHELRLLYNIALSSCKTCSKHAMPGGFIWLWVHQWAETHKVCPTLMFKEKNYDQKSVVCLATEQNLVSLIGMLDRAVEDGVIYDVVECLRSMLREMVKAIHKRTVSLNSKESLR
jgi:hypothetical protein